MASGPDRVWPVRAAHAPARKTLPAAPAARNCKGDTLLAFVTDEVVPILIGNVWQSAKPSLFVRNGFSNA
jgi:hypothetical protein